MCLLNVFLSELFKQVAEQRERTREKKCLRIVSSAIIKHIKRKLIAYLSAKQITVGIGGTKMRASDSLAWLLWETEYIYVDEIIQFSTRTSRR